MVFFLVKRWICLSFLPFFLLKNKSGENETLNIYNIKWSLIWNTYWVTIYVVRNQLCKLYHYTKSYNFSIATNTWTFMTDRNRCYYQANFWHQFWTLTNCSTIPGTLHIRDLKHLYENNGMFSFQFKNIQTPNRLIARNIQLFLKI